MTKLRLSILTAACVLLASCGDKEYREVVDNVGFSGDAARNPQLALQYLLQGQGYHVEADQMLPRDLHNHDVIVCPLESLPSSGKRFEELKTWVHNGGLLITGLPGRVQRNNYGHRSAWRSWVDEDDLSPPLLRFLEVESLVAHPDSEQALTMDVEDIEMPELPDLSPDDGEEDPADGLFGIPEPIGEHVTTADTQTNTEEVSASRYSLSVRPTQTYAFTDSLRVNEVMAACAWHITPPGLQARDGRGVLLLSDFGMLENIRIAESDNAVFISDFISESFPAYTPDQLQIGLFQLHVRESMLSTLWKDYKPGFLTLFLLLGLGALTLRRFAPIQEEPPDMKSSDLMHINSHANWLWKLDRFASLSAAQRHLIQRRAGENLTSYARQQGVDPDKADAWMREEDEAHRFVQHTRRRAALLRRNKPTP